METSLCEHRCKYCRKGSIENENCDAKEIVWGIDIDPSARGAEADKVVSCKSFEIKTEQDNNTSQ